MKRRKERRRKTKAKISGGGKKGNERERAKKRKCCKAWERASPLAERARERERFHKPGYASILHRKPTPTFTLAARPDDSMLKDGRLAG